MIQNKNIRTYSVNSYNEFISLDQKTEFLMEIYGHGIEQIEFSVKSGTAFSSDLILTIYDNVGNIIGEVSQTDIGQIIDAENGEIEYTISYYISQFNLLANQKYYATLETDPKTSIELCCLSDGTPWNKQIYHSNYNSIYYLILAFIDIVEIICFILILKRGLHTKIFFIISTLSGIIESILIAPASQPDEYRHFIRAYEISQGRLTTNYQPYTDDIIGNTNWLTVGVVALAEIPEELNQIRLLDTSHNFNEKSYDAEVNHNVSLDKMINILEQDTDGTTAKVSQVAVETLSPLSYIPQVLLILIGKFLGMRPFLLYYMARLGNVIVCTCLACICLQLVPQYKAGVWAIFFMPHACILRSSCSPDGLILTLTMLTISFIIYLKENKLPLYTIKHISILLCLSFYIAMMKLPYMLIIATLIILDKNNFKTPKYCFIKTSALAIIIICLSYLFYFLMGTIRLLEINSKLLDGQQINTQPLLSANHIQYVINHIPEVAVMFGKEMLKIFDMYIYAVNGWRYPFGATYWLLLLVTLLVSNKICEWSKKTLIFLLYAAIWLVVLIVGFAWLPPDIGYIWGINGRYMLPMVPVLLTALPFGNEKTSKISEALRIPLVFFTLMNQFTLYQSCWL